MMYNDSLMLGHATVMNNIIVFAKTNNFIISRPEKKINYYNSFGVELSHWMAWCALFSSCRNSFGTVFRLK